MGVGGPPLREAVLTYFGSRKVAGAKGVMRALGPERPTSDQLASTLRDLVVSEDLFQSGGLYGTPGNRHFVVSAFENQKKASGPDLMHRAEVVNRIRDDLEGMAGGRVHIRVNHGRSRIVEREGTLVATHPALFVIELQEKRDRTSRASFQYADVLTGTVELSHSDTRGNLLPWLDRAYSRPSSDTEPSPEWIGIAMVNGVLRLVTVAPDGQAVLLDALDGPSTLLIVDARRLALMAAIDELEWLMNNDAPESAYQKFFEGHPEFLVPDEYARAIPQVTLVREDGKALRPDFMLEPYNQRRFADILELKLPSVPVVVGSPGRERFSAKVHAACAQLKEYRDYFEHEGHRTWFENHNGSLRAFRPAMWLVVGRRGDIDPLAFRRLECEVPMVHLRTYDDLLERAKSRFSL